MSTTLNRKKAHFAPTVKKGQRFFLTALMLSGNTNNIETSGLPLMVGSILLTINMIFGLISNIRSCRFKQSYP
jgi:hypothetical protein